MACANRIHGRDDPFALVATEPFRQRPVDLDLVEE
jgi:hypothetical protein